jgi:NADH-quinone oxidoreductase subunit M
MILVLLIAAPVAGGLIGWLVSRRSVPATRWVALAAMTTVFVLALSLWRERPVETTTTGGAAWIVQVQWPWIQPLGISFHLAIDGLSLVMVTLSAVLGAVAVAVSWTTVKERAGFFHLNLMLVLAGVTGVFLALDLFLFYFFWELMLVPMFFLIDVWGHENRHYAAIKFFIFTQLSGLLMLISIIALYFVHGKSTGIYTFDYADLLGTKMSSSTEMWLMLGFFAAFAVKLPAVPFHTWLPDAHTEAPTAGSVILAGLLLKTGAYGLIRFAVPLFPGAAMSFAGVAAFLGVAGIIYGAVMAFAQRDFKRLVAYTSVSHLGFVLLGVFAWTRLSLVGSIVQMVAHGVSTGALFVVAGMLQDRLGTRDMRRMGGLWASLPLMGGAAMVFAMASLGLPGLGNFIGEFLTLLGAYHVYPVLTIVAALGLVLATVYALWMMQRAFFGAPRAEIKAADLGVREIAVMAVMIVAIAWLGLFPQPVLTSATTALDGISRAAATPPFGHAAQAPPAQGEAPTAPAAPAVPEAGGSPAMQESPAAPEGGGTP